MSSSTNPSKDDENNATNNATNNVGVDSIGSSSSSSKKAWKLEESSLWWLSYCWSTDENNNTSGWLQHPGNILFLTSVPLIAGTYFGLRMPADRLEDIVGGSMGDGGDNNSNNNKDTMSRKAAKIKTAADKDAIKAVAAQTASRALRIATLGTVGTFGFIGALGFYASGYDTIEGAVMATKRWTTSFSTSVESFFGGDTRDSKTHPEVQATKHMDGNEELQYIYDKYIKEEVEEDDKNGAEINNPQDQEDPPPTLFTIYQKYFPKKDDE
jgi:hypothetical protein